MGSAAAWQLARGGRSVTLLERFAAGHTNGASHGASRNLNLSYAEPTYLALLAEALPLWRDLEAETGTSLLEQVGIVNHGANAAFDEVARALEVAGFEAQFVQPSEAERRWPGIRFDQRVLFTPQAGRLNADAAVTALQRAAAAHGAQIRCCHRSGCPYLSLRPRPVAGAAALRARMVTRSRPRRLHRNQLHVHHNPRLELRARPSGGNHRRRGLLGPRLHVHARDRPSARRPR